MKKVYNLGPRILIIPTASSLVKASDLKKYNIYSLGVCTGIYYVKCSKILNPFLFLFSNKILGSGLEFTKCLSE